VAARNTARRGSSGSDDAPATAKSAGHRVGRPVGRVTSQGCIVQVATAVGRRSTALQRSATARHDAKVHHIARQDTQHAARCTAFQQRTPCCCSAPCCDATSSPRRRPAKGARAFNRERAPCTCARGTRGVLTGYSLGTRGVHSVQQHPRERAPVRVRSRGPYGGDGLAARAACRRRWTSLQSRRESPYIKRRGQEACGVGTCNR
jgi:hypothetical protein